MSRFAILLAGLSTALPSSPLDLRDRALIGVLVYSFARIGAAVAMNVDDLYIQGRRTWLHLHEKAASVTTCPPTTNSRTTSTPTSRPPVGQPVELVTVSRVSP